MLEGTYLENGGLLAEGTTTMAGTPPLRRILYVEDDPDIRLLLRLSLEQLGKFTTLGCADPGEALAAADAFAPDLLLLDVMMPGMDGPTLLAALRERTATRDTPAIFMTARAQAADIERYRERGAAEVMVKPFDPITLAERIRAVWERIHART